MVLHEGNSPACYGNGPMHNGNSPMHEENSPAQRKWSRIAFQSPIETPSQWDHSLLGNHNAYSAPVQHLFQPMRGHSGRSRIQSARAKAPTTHLAPFYYRCEDGGEEAAQDDAKGICLSSQRGYIVCDKESIVEYNWDL